MVNDLDNVIRTTRLDAARQKGEERRCNICSGIFKNEHDVQIPQGMSKHKELLKQHKAPDTTQRLISKFISSACQSVVNQSQETNHSTPDLSAQLAWNTGRGGESERLVDFERKPQLNLPPAADRRWA